MASSANPSSVVAAAAFALTSSFANADPSANPNPNSADPSASPNPNSTVADVMWNFLAGTTHVSPPGSYAYFFPEGESDQYGIHVAPEDLPKSRILVKVLEAERAYLPNKQEPIVNYQLQQVEQLYKQNNLPYRPQYDVIARIKVILSTDLENLIIPGEFARVIFGVRKTPATTELIMQGFDRTWVFKMQSFDSYRHVIYYGWKDFVIENQLVAGDKVVFLKNMESNQLYIGIRKVPDIGEPVITPEVEVNGDSFRTVHFPWRTRSFVVEAKYVNNTSNKYYGAGLSVITKVQSEKGNEMAVGRIQDVRESKVGGWENYPWKMIGVDWHYKPSEVWVSDLPERFSPWELRVHPSLVSFGDVFPMLDENSGGREVRLFGVTIRTEENPPTE